MPTYDYKCKSCEHSYEAFHSMNDDSVQLCPECGGESKRLLSGGSGVIFKGSGYYVNDSKSKPKPKSKPKCPSGGCCNGKC